MNELGTYLKYIKLIQLKKRFTTTEVISLIHVEKLVSTVIKFPL